MKNKLNFLFFLIFSCTFAFAQYNYYVEILCDNEKDLPFIKNLLKKQSWYEEDKLFVNTTTILIGPYELEKATEIKNFLITDLNLPANVCTQVLENNIIECNHTNNNDTKVSLQEDEDLEYDLVVSSWSNKEVNEDIVKLYTDEKVKKIIRSALKLYTTPYKWGGTNVEKGIDCSFFVKFVFSELGINLPRTSREQFKIGIPVEKDQLKCGDLVFFKKIKYKKVKGKIKKYEYINHVGIYLINNEFIHATLGSKKVTISSLEEPYYKTHYAGARRVLKDDM